MSMVKVFLMSCVLLFTVIGITATVKKLIPSSQKKEANAPPLAPSVKNPEPKVFLTITPESPEPIQEDGDFPKVDRIDQFFTTGPTKLPIVETIAYTSRVAWLKGRPAWIGDYSSHYATSKHFIARSLNKKRDYATHSVSIGSLFNVFRKDRNFQFYLLVDLSLCKMGFYYIDLDTNERVLIKTYCVGLGRKEETASGTETPLGKYLLGDKIAVYKPGIRGFFQNKQVEMIEVFGTRWIPFGKSLADCSVSQKGYGIHGAPWSFDIASEQWIEDRSVIGSYASDGCIRLGSEDIEELFAIIITKPTIIEIVQKFQDAKLPGVEVTLPMR